jgi:hypothetical protein
MQEAHDDTLTEMSSAPSVQEQSPQCPPDGKLADLFVGRQLVQRPSAQGGYGWAARRA